MSSDACAWSQCEYQPLRLRSEAGQSTSNIHPIALIGNVLMRVRRPDSGPGMVSRIRESRQIVDGFPALVVKVLTRAISIFNATYGSVGRGDRRSTARVRLDEEPHRCGEGLFGDEGLGVPPNFPGSPHGVKCAAHELGGSCTTLFVSGLRLEKLGVSQNDTQLIIQPVKQQS